MNWVFKSASVGAMVGSLATPLYRAQNQTVGVVLDAESAHVSNGLLASGTSLYSADVVKTESQGHVQLRIRQTRLQLAGQSEAALFSGAHGAVADLRQGTMVVALNTASESFEVFVSDVRIIPKNERPVLAEVTMKAPCDFQIKVMHGRLEATAAKETKTLDEGHTYDVTPEFDISDTQPGNLTGCLRIPSRASAQYMRAGCEIGPATSLPEKKTLCGSGCHRRYRCRYDSGSSRGLGKSRQTLADSRRNRYVLILFRFRA